MERQGLEQTANELVTKGKDIPAADETVSTISKRFEAPEILSTRDSRRTCREMLFTTVETPIFSAASVRWAERPVGTPAVSAQL